jgi:hypothetical protein
MKVSGKIAWKIIACALLVSGCAATHPSALVDCPRDPALARGVRDGASGHRASTGFLHFCTPESRAAALSAYREGFAQSHPKVKKASLAPADANAKEDAEDSDDETAGVAADPATAPALPLTPPVREPSAISWVCEVEANSRVFTGVGQSQDEAVRSARETCGSHFQASYCTKADCKQNM